MAAPDLLKLCDLWERQTRTRQPYLTGAIGAAKVLVFKRNNPGEGEPAWTVFLAPRSERPAAAPRPEPAAATAASRDAHVAALGARFHEDDPDEVLR